MKLHETGTLSVIFLFKIIMLMLHNIKKPNKKKFENYCIYLGVRQKWLQIFL